MNTKLSEDICLAKQIVTSEKNESDQSVFSDRTGMYRGTTEIISKLPYQDALRNRNRILSVIASGDQIINSILLGSTDIIGYDISRFPKYYLMLKLAAIKSLSKHQYSKFFFHQKDEEVHTGTLVYSLKSNSKLFSEKLYTKLYSNLEKEAQVFWNSLFNSFNVEKLINSPLFMKPSVPPSIDKMYYQNPYLNGFNYRIVQSKLDKVNIQFYQDNIFELVDKEIGEFDLVNLSNIFSYYINCYPNYSKIENYKKMVEKLPLTSSGIAITYIESFNTYLNWSYLDNFDERYQKICFDKGEFYFPADGLLIYEKEKALKKTL